MKKTIKTAVDAIDDINSVLVAKGVDASVGLTGEIRNTNRMLDSDKEDIVTNCLFFDAEQFQGGDFNINAHVPNLLNQPTPNPMATDNTQPDIERMQVIGKAIIEAVDYHYGHDFFLHVSRPGELTPDGNNWFYNIRVEYRTVRLDK